MQNEPTNLDVRRSVVDATVNNVFDSRIEYQSDKDSVIIQSGEDFGDVAQLDSTHQELILNQQN